jgi:hypothetical protein
MSKAYRLQWLFVAIQGLRSAGIKITGSDRLEAEHGPESEAVFPLAGSSTKNKFPNTAVYRHHVAHQWVPLFVAVDQGN